MKTTTSATKVAFCGVISAVSFVLLCISAVVPVLSYSLPAMSGILLIIVALSLGQSAAWTIYVSVSILSLLFVPNKECAVMFVAFFGYYPVLKIKLEQLHLRPMVWASKLLTFNVSAVLAQLVVIKVLGVPLEEMESLGKWAIPLLLLLANVLFLLYDVLLSQLRRLYCLKWKKYVQRILK